MEYGLRLAVGAAPPRDPRDACPRPWRDLLPEGPAVALYFGSEFCEDRLPDASEALAFCAMAGDSGWEPTLLTPLVTPAGLLRVDRLLGALRAGGAEPAVVFNDWGVLGVAARAAPVAAAAGRPADEPLAARPARVSRRAGRLRDP